MPGLKEQLNRAYFWDISTDMLDEIKSKRIIIERVMNYGSLNEIKLVINYYGEEEIKKTVCDLNHIDPKTLNFLSLLLDIPKIKFKCYKKKRSINQHSGF